jgi:hypothetical protein
MTVLAARLEALLRSYAAARHQEKDDGSRSWEQFRTDLQSLIAEYGPNAVDAALDELPDGAGAAISLH